MGSCINNKSAMVAMSGGVDSSVAALLLKEQGLSVVGATMELLSAESDNAKDAKRVADQLGILHYTFDMRGVFSKKVIDYFVSSYLEGRTPNPCIECNRKIKFGVLDQRREELGCDLIATGHYAKIAFNEETGRWNLLRSDNIGKDQSYFLYQLSQEQLSRTLFPLESLTKDEVRKFANQSGFANSGKSESQDICFIENGNYSAFIEEWGNSEDADSKNAGFESEVHCAKAFQAGDIENSGGKVLGQHSGLVHYTIGQRKGIGIAAPEPLYVIDKDASRNVLIVGYREELLVKSIDAKDANFIAVTSQDAENSTLRTFAKTTYRQEPRAATASFNDGILHIEFDEPIVCPAAGQAVVLYDAENAKSVQCGATII